MKPSHPKKIRDLVDGVLLLDKPVGLSSNDALIKAKRVLNAKKAGHTGTLDPFATGLLPLCFGEATKFSQDLLEADKTYDTTVHLGITTNTGDTEGVVETTFVWRMSNTAAVANSLMSLGRPRASYLTPPSIWWPSLGTNALPVVASEPMTGSNEVA